MQARLGEQFAILGLAAEPAELRPGDAATVTVRWQVLAPGPVDYSVFVHLVDDDDLVIAQLDTMPGGGLLPTSQWTAGQTLTERYRGDPAPYGLHTGSGTLGGGAVRPSRRQSPARRAD